MHASTALVALGLAGLSAAAPYGEQPTGSWKGGNGAQIVSYLTKFDNVEAGLVGGLELYFNLNALDVGNGLAGVKPQSAPNVVAFDAIATATEGEPSILADFDGSTVDSFNLQSFYFGCVVANAETAASVPVDCSITITGYRNGEEVASQDADFTTGSLLTLVANMDKVTLSSDFSNVDKVTFAIDGALDSTLDAALFDNFAYDVTLKQGYSSFKA